MIPRGVASTVRRAARRPIRAAIVTGAIIGVATWVGVTVVASVPWVAALAVPGTTTVACAPCAPQTTFMNGGPALIGAAAAAAAGGLAAGGTPGGHSGAATGGKPPGATGGETGPGGPGGDGPGTSGGTPPAAPGGGDGPGVPADADEAFFERCEVRP